jgi:rsbT co-antagonist protein RsbR
MSMIRQFSSWLLKNQATDEETRRLAQNVQIIALGMITLALLFVPLVMLNADPTRSLVAIVVVVLTFSAAFVAARRGRPMIGSVILVATTTLALCSSLTASDVAPTTPFFFALALAIAGATLRPSYIWWVIGAVLAALWAALLAPPQNFLSTPTGMNNAANGSLFLVMIGVLVYLSAASAGHALKQAAQARAVALAAQTDLADLNRSLEHRIDERTAALETALEQQRAQSEELRSSVEIQQQLSQTILDLSLPVIPVTDQVLIAPLIGNIDSRRANELLSSVLSEVERRGAHALVLDVTGVSVIDTAVAQVLMKLAEANRLLGSKTILVGIRPEVAQALTSLGVNFHTLASAATLQQGLSLVGVDLDGRS